MSTARHTSAHTSPVDGAVFRDSRKARETGHPKKASLPSSIHKVLQLSNNKKSGPSSFPGKQPAPTILLILLGDLGAGAAPASLQLQLTVIGNRQGFRCFMSELDLTVK
jgi:hypothetical protein